jgi:hypothetical protein
MKNNLGDDAKTMLNYFKAKELLQGDYVYPAILEALFDRPERCEAAQTELARLGLLDLAAEPSKHRTTKVRPATLSLDGARLLQNSFDE